MIDPDLVLWRQVLVIGLHDAATGQDPDWLESEDFETVCTLASVDPQAVLERFEPDLFKRKARAA